MFFLTPLDSEIHLPSDLLGMTAGEYETERRDQSMEAAVGPFCTKVRKKLEQMWLSVDILRPEPDAQIEIGWQTIICRCTNWLGPNIFVFTQSTNGWWPRSERLKKINDYKYEVQTYFSAPIFEKIHIVTTNDLAMLSTNNYLALRKQMNEARGAAGLTAAYPPFMTGKELPQGFVRLAEITVEVVPKPV